MSVFSTGKHIIDKNPKLLNISSVLFNVFSLNRKTIKGKSNNIIIRGSFLKKCKIVIHGNNNTVALHPKCYLTGCTISIFGSNCRVKIGSQVCIHNGQIHIEDDNGEIDIGDNSLLLGQTHLAAIEGTTIGIGKECLLSSNVVFRTGDSHSVLDINGNRINPSRSIVIGDHVWIGSQTILLKGSGLSNDSILGAGSVLGKRITESNVAVAGNPASIVKTDINWDKNRKV